MVKNANKKNLNLNVHFERLEEVIQWKIGLGMLNSANRIENCSQESQCYKTELKNKLISSAKDAKTFWSTLKGISLKKKVNFNGNIDQDI